MSKLQVAFQQVCLQLHRGGICCQHWDLQRYIGQHRPWGDLYISENVVRVAQEGPDLRSVYLLRSRCRKLCLQLSELRPKGSMGLQTASLRSRLTAYFLSCCSFTTHAQACFRQKI